MLSNATKLSEEMTSWSNARMTKRSEMCRSAGLRLLAMVLVMFSFKTRAFLLSRQESQQVLQSISTATPYSDVSSEDMDIRELYPSPNPLFETTNVISRKMEIPNRNVWEMTVPPIEDHGINVQNFWKNIIQKRENESLGRIGIDESVEFSDAYEGAKILVKECFKDIEIDEKSGSYRETLQYIQEIFEHFQTIVSPSQSSVETGATSFKARIVSTRGPRGQKCPRWHVDHVPLRLVMSLVGPGCRYIPHESEGQSEERILNREALNGLDEQDTERANKIILPQGEEGIVLEALAGDFVLLLGRAWEGQHVLAVPHCSPPLDTKEGRVLLTVDVIPNPI